MMPFWGCPSWSPRLPAAGRHWRSRPALIRAGACLCDPPTRVQRDGIHLHGLRYFSTTLAAYVGEPVTIRYDPRDLAEIRIYHHGE